jgi:hypothetical protein
MEVEMRYGVGIVLIIVMAGFGVAAPASADNPPGVGPPGQSCEALGPNNTPGHAASSPGSPFNPAGKAGRVYSPNSQYDVACFQQAAHNP